MQKTAALALMLAVAGTAHAADKPDWAYPPQPKPPVFDAVQPHDLPGSNKHYTRAEVNDRFNPPDWYPDEHPPMPHAVAYGGPRPAAPACALCHLPSGDGHPESASIAGLPEEYMLRQMAAFKAQERHNNRAPLMSALSAALTEGEIAEAVHYYTGLKPRAGWDQVKESATVPATFVGPGGMRFAVPGSPEEPIGSRIITLPQNPEQAELRDPHTGFVDLVPPGSIQRGEVLATTGGGKTVPCGICHGPDLHGLAGLPPIAGRHAIYTFRQLRDMHDGDRTGGMTALMTGVVAPLSDDDMIDLSAYLASLEP